MGRKILWTFKKALAAVSYDYNFKLYNDLLIKTYNKEKISSDEAWWLMSQRENFN